MEISHELIIHFWSAIHHIKENNLFYDMGEERLNPNLNLTI